MIIFSIKERQAQPQPPINVMSHIQTNCFSCLFHDDQWSPNSWQPERRVIAEDGSLVRSLHFSSTILSLAIPTLASV